MPKYPKLIHSTVSKYLYVEQTHKYLFKVVYGKQVVTGLSYEQAAKKYGECIFHHCACEGLIF